MAAQIAALMVEPMEEVRDRFQGSVRVSKCLLVKPVETMCKGTVMKTLGLAKKSSDCWY